MGFALRRRFALARWSLTPPFHPYRGEPRRFCFCGTFHPCVLHTRFPPLQRDILPYGVRTFLRREAGDPSSSCPAEVFFEVGVGAGDFFWGASGHVTRIRISVIVLDSSGLVEDSSAVVAGNDFHIGRVVDQQRVPLHLLVFRGGQAHMATAAAEVSVGVFDMDENGEELFTEAFVVGEEAAFFGGIEDVSEAFAFFFGGLFAIVVCDQVAVITGEFVGDSIALVLEQDFGFGDDATGFFEGFASFCEASLFGIESILEASDLAAHCGDFLHIAQIGAHVFLAGDIGAEGLDDGFDGADIPFSPFDSLVQVGNLFFVLIAGFGGRLAAFRDFLDIFDPFSDLFIFGLQSQQIVNHAHGASPK